MYLELGHYWPGCSIVHNLDPRTKIAGLFLYSLALLLAPSLRTGLEVSALIPVAVGVSQVPVVFLWRQVRPLLPFLAFAVIVQALFMPVGEMTYNLGPLAFGRQSLNWSALTCLRIIGLVLVAGLLTATTSPLRLTDGLEALLKPARRLGLPAQELAVMLTLGLRFIPLLLDEAEAVKRAQEARGADFNAPLGKSLKLLLSLVVPLLLGIFRRAGDIAQAMEARCYQSGRERTKMYTLRMGLQDYVVLVLISLMTLWSAYQRWFGI